MEQSLLDQLLAALSDAARAELLTPHLAELATLFNQWSQQAWESGLAGDHRRALAINQLLLGIATNAGNRDVLASTWSSRGHLLSLAGQAEEARRCWQQALDMFDQPPPNLSGRANVALSLGTSYWQSGAYQAALPHLQAALADFAQSPAGPPTGYAHTRLGDCLQGLGRPAEAIASYERARKVFAGLGNYSAVADRWCDIGKVQMAAGQPGAAAGSLQEAVRAAEVSGDAGCLCRALETLGYVQGMGLHEYPAALATFRREIEAAGGQADLAAAHVQAANMCELLARWDEAAGHYRQAMSVYESTGERLGQASCQEGLARAYKRQGQYAAAKTAYEQAMAVYRYRSELAGSVIRVEGELGQLAWEWGYPEEALQHYNAALAQAQAVSDWAWAGFICGTLGALYETALNLPDVARQHYRQAAEYYERSDTLEGRLRAGRQRGDLALAAGSPEQAVTWYRRTAQEARLAGDWLALADTYRALAQAHAASGGYEAARQSQRQAIRLYRRMNLPQQVAQACVDLAELHGRFGRHERAIRAYRLAIRQYRAVDDSSGAALTQVSLAQEYFALKRYAGAQRILKRALAAGELETFEAFNTAHTAYLGLGAADERLGRPGHALGNYRRAIELAERHRADLILPEFKQTFLGSRQNLYARAVLLSARQGRGAQALSYAESSRSRAFLNWLALTPLPQSPGRIAPGLLADEALWLNRLRGLLARQATDVASADYWSQVRAAWEHLEAAWAAIGDEEYAALRQGRPITPAELREYLRAAG
jgi:tetratricopeptide (TPR) repeat protein